LPSANPGIGTKSFLSFLRRIDQEVTKNLKLHLIVDNYSTNKHTKVRAWLSQRPRFRVHYNPTQEEC